VTHLGPAATTLSAALLDLDSRGERTPCQTEPGSGYWTSDVREEREQAAAWCIGCSVLDLCAAAADESRERWHVWAGIDRGPKPPGRARSAA